jgi:hypothetical protein
MTPSELRQRAFELLEELRGATQSREARDILTTAEQLLWAAEELEGKSDGTDRPGTH